MNDMEKIAWDLQGQRMEVARLREALEDAKAALTAPVEVGSLSLTLTTPHDLYRLRQCARIVRETDLR